MSRSSERLVRVAIGRRFNIAPHRVKPDDIKTFMSYFTMLDLEDLSESEMAAFLKEGRSTGMFFARKSDG